MVTATQISVYVCMDMCNSVIVWADLDPAADLNLTQNINNCSRFQHLPSLWHQGTVPQYCTEGDRLVSSVPLSEARSQVLNALALSNETRWLCTSSQESSVCLSPCLNFKLYSMSFVAGFIQTPHIRGGDSKGITESWERAGCTGTEGGGVGASVAGLRRRCVTVWHWVWPGRAMGWREGPDFGDAQSCNLWPGVGDLNWFELWRKGKIWTVL